MSHHLPVAMARYEYNYTTGSPWKLKNTVWQTSSFPVPACFWAPIKSVMRAEAITAVHSGPAARGESAPVHLHLQSFFIVFGKACESLALLRCAFSTLAKQKYCVDHCGFYSLHRWAILFLFVWKLFVYQIQLWWPTGRYSSVDKDKWYSRIHIIPISFYWVFRIYPPNNQSYQ